MTKIASRGTSTARTAGAFGLLGVVLALAGCGGSSDPGVAHLGSGTGSHSASAAQGGGESTPLNDAERQRKMVAFAQCMRSHGVPEFPEPSGGHILVHPGGASGLNKGSAQLEAASKSCRKLLPNGGAPTPQQRAQAQEQALKFSACMRSHGLPNFPTPTFEGNAVRLSLKAGSGLDPNSPQFQAAQKACRSYFGGPGGPKGAPGGSESGGGGAKGSGQAGGNLAIGP